MRGIWQDLRFGFRVFTKSPMPSAVAVLSLALGIGASSTIFSVMNAFIYRPLPFPEPDRLVVIHESLTSERGNATRDPKHSTVLQWRNESKTIEKVGVVGFGVDAVTLAGVAEADRVTIQYVDNGLFSVLGINPALGRDFLPSDGASRGTAVILSHDLWQRAFGGDPGVIGNAARIDGEVCTVVGVMPPGFWVLPGQRADVWRAISLATTPDMRWLTPLARLKPGVTVEQTHAEMAVSSAAQATEEETQAGVKVGARVETLQEAMLGGARILFYFLLGTVGFVLLIACANVANLLLAQAAGRTKEVALRASLGARRGRLIRQLLTESLLLGLAGGLLGVLFTELGIQVFLALAPQWLPRADDLVIDGRVLGFTLGVSLMTGIIFGLAPAWRESRSDLTESLKEGGGRTGVVGPGRGRSMLLVSEVALAIVLLLGAGLMMNSFIRLQRVDGGFNPANLLTAEVLLGGRTYWEHALDDTKRVKPQGDTYFQEVLDNVRNLPGVTGAGMITRLPTHGAPTRALQILGKPQANEGEGSWAVFNEVTPGLLELMEVPLRKGRYITEQDVDGAPWVVVVNESFAKKYFPEEAPLGQLVQLSIITSAGGHFSEEKPRQIVGVVGDVKHLSLRMDTLPAMYGSNLQHPWVYPGGFYAEHYRQHLVVRTTGDPMGLVSAVRTAVAEADPDQPAYDFMTMEQRLAESLSLERFSMRLFGTFAILAIMLASVGIYGVMAHLVTQRTHEIGVRRALGALENNVLSMVIRQGLKLTIIGMAIGLLASWGLTRFLARILFGVTPTDPLTYLVVVLVMFVVALLATWLPARRASRIDPMTALRYE